MLMKLGMIITDNGKTTYMEEKLNVKRSSCTNAIYAEFGRFPLIKKPKSSSSKVLAKAIVITTWTCAKTII